MLSSVFIVSDGRRAALLQREAPDALVLTDPDALTGESRFELATVAGVLEQERWDRWLLQRIHRALRMHGRLVLHVPRLASMRAVADGKFLRYAGRKLVERALDRWRPGTQLDGAVHRRYRLRRLARTLETLGFVDVVDGAGATLVARKASSLPGIGGRPWPDAQAHRGAFTRDYAFLERARESWLAKHPAAEAREASRRLDPPQWGRFRILVLSPHPDDELIGCGGTLCRLRDAGATLCILQATDGSRLPSLSDLPADRRRSVRLEEAARVADALGAHLELWRAPDGALSAAQAGGRLARLLDEFQPTHVFTPFLADGHADHRALSIALAAALAASREAPQVVQYEVWGLVPANLYCDVTLEAPLLERLLHLYERAMRADDFVHFCARRNLARALELTGRPGYAEAFLSMTSAQYRNVA